MTFVATIDTDPATDGDFATAGEAVRWAESRAHGAAWVVAELLPDQPPRIVATGLPDDDGCEVAS